MKKNFRPKCLISKTSMAVNNRNELIPCCFWDEPNRFASKFETDSCPTASKLVAVSNIDKHNSIADILKQKEWFDFYESIVEAEIIQNYKSVSKLCKHQCLDMGEPRFRKEKTFNSQGELESTYEK